MFTVNAPVDLYPMGSWQWSFIKGALEDWTPDPTEYQPFQRKHCEGNRKLRFSHMMHRLERLGCSIESRRGYRGRREFRLALPGTGGGMR